MEDDRRSQPEFSLGERLARIEAELICSKEDHTNDQQSLQRRLSQAERLADEKRNGIRVELGAINQAQKEAVAKSELSTERRLELIGVQMQADRDSTNKRLQALERGESLGSGVHQGASELKASTIAVIGALAALALVILYVAHP